MRGASTSRAVRAALMAAGLYACGKGPQYVAEDGGDEGGNIHVHPMIVNCPTVSVLTVSPSELDLGQGGKATISGLADLPTLGIPAYTWTATSGVLTDPYAHTTTFECTEPGVVTLTLTATFDGCSDFADTTVNCLDLDGAASD